MFQVQSGVTATISGLTITGGTRQARTATGRRRPVIYGTATLIDCTISGNSATTTAAGLNDGTATLDAARSAATPPRITAAACTDHGTLDLTACTISGNSAVQMDGGLIARRQL